MHVDVRIAEGNAVLFEGGFANLFDKVIVVVRELNARVESVKKRSAINEEEILAELNLSR